MDTTSALLSTYILNALWQIPLITLTAWLCVRLASRLPARYRHAVWVAALLASVVLPLASLPKLRDMPGQENVSSTHYTVDNSSNPLLLDTGREMFLRGLRGHSRNISLAPILKWSLVTLYIVFLTYRLFRLVWIWRRTRQLAASVSDVDLPEAARNIADGLARKCSLSNVSIRSSSETASPFISGIRRPVLVIPDAILRESSPDDLSSILAHEFAHLQRRDFALNLIYEIFQLPIAFHPATYVLKEHIDRSRELACDEMAAEHTRSRISYASSLLRVARAISKESVRQQANHALGLFYADNLEERIMSLLRKNNRIGNRWGKVLLGAVVAIFAVMCFGLSAYTLRVSAAGNSEYLGTWRAEYHGKNFMVVTLKPENANLSGFIRMMNTQINLEGNGEVYHVSGELTEPTSLTNVHPDGKALVFDYLEEGDKDPVHWKMELTSPGTASLSWLQLPAGLHFKPILLTKDAAGGSPAETTGPQSTQNTFATEFVLGDLKIEGDVHDRDAVRDRILKAWKDRTFRDSKELVESVIEVGVRADFQDRGYFKVVAHDPAMQPLDNGGGTQRLLVIVQVNEGDQFRLKTLTILNIPHQDTTGITAAAIRDQFHIHDGDLFNVAEIRAGLERVLKLYKDHGYSNVAPVPETLIDPSMHRIILNIRITEAPQKP